MTHEQFVYWLQGYMEVCGEVPNEGQWKVIQDHLKTVFHKITPIYRTTGDDFPLDPGFYLPKTIC